MVEVELESIKNKLKEDNFNLSDLERKLLKIEKKLLQYENKLNITLDNDDNKDIYNEINSDSESNINIDLILKELEKLESEITNINTNISIEKLIENYISFKMKLQSLKIKNEEFKLKIEYL